MLIPAASNIVLYGKGVFTTIAIRGGRPFLWEKHWRRLTNNARTVAIDLSAYSEESAFDQLNSSIEKERLVNGRARITLVDDSPSPLWPSAALAKISLFITSGDRRLVPENFKLSVSPYPVNSLSPLAGVKSCNYLEKILALDEAKARGFDEAIQLNERSEVTSAVMANVFWLKDGVVHTPSLKTGCLPGTTREFVLENCEGREVEATLDNLSKADAIFLTSAGLGVTQVAEFEGRHLEKIDHPILDLLPKHI